MVFPTILPIAILVFAALLIWIYLRLRKLGRGERPITIRRKSTLTTQAGWTALQYAWEKTALTFLPTEFLATEDPTTRIFANALNGRVTEHIIKVLSVTLPMSVGFRTFRENDIDYPSGQEHFERWSVVEDGTASRIEVVTQFRRSPLATGWTLLSLWRKAGLLASGRATDTVSSLRPPGFIRTSQPPPRPQPARRVAPGKDSQSFDFARYQREATMSLLAFVVLLIQYSWQSAIVLSVVILWHEYGHLLAYQLTGRKGNRLMLVPFFGGIAVAGAPHRNEFERAFCALAGPGICAPLTVASFAVWYWTDNSAIAFWAWRALYFSAILNLLNLLPIYPLDGGHTAESYLRSYAPYNVPKLLMGLSAAGLFAIAAMGYFQTFLFMALFAFLSLRTVSGRSRLAKLTTHETLLISAGYLVVSAVHALGFYFILNPPIRFE